MSAALLELRAVSAGHGAREVLREVSLVIRPGEVVALVGANGAGKSTLLQAAAGLLPVRSGELRIGDLALAAMSRLELARRVAYLPQAASTDADYRVESIVELGRFPHVGPYRAMADHDRAAVARAMTDAGVSELATRTFPTLSEGEKQRVLLARCFAQEAAVLLLDEPTASLDVRHAWTLIETVRKKAEAGAAVLLAVHDLALAARIGDRIAVLAGGELLADAEPLEALSADNLARAFGIRALVRRGDEGAITLTVLGPS